MVITEPICYQVKSPMQLFTNNSRSDFFLQTKVYIIHITVMYYTILVFRSFVQRNDDGNKST